MKNICIYIILCAHTNINAYKHNINLLFSPSNKIKLGVVMKIRLTQCCNQRSSVSIRNSTFTVTNNYHDDYLSIIYIVSTLRKKCDL